MSKISVIIPIYNASRYLPRCIDSILAQTFTDWQLLLVDDGSTDDSLQVMQEYQTKDRRIKCFHKQNEGVSLTRQYGLDRVETPYFIYCDADDYVELDYLELLYKAIKEDDADLAVCDYREEYKDKSVLMATSNSSVEGLVINFLIDKAWGVTWNKLYKTEIVKKHTLHFIPRIQMWEDLAFTIDYCLFSKKVSFVHKVLYHYDKTLDSSITKHENIQKKVDRVIAIRHFESTMKQTGKYDIYEKYLMLQKYHVSYIAIDNVVNRERLRYFLTSFPEMFGSSYLFKKHPLVLSIVNLKMTWLLYVGAFARKIKNKLRLIIKK